jgi:hypothetical protein
LQRSREESEKVIKAQVDIATDLSIFYRRPTPIPFRLTLKRSFSDDEESEVPAKRACVQ